MKPMRNVSWDLICVAALLFFPALVSAQGVERDLERHAGIGETVRISGHVNYHPCGSVIPTAILVNVAPNHGSIAVRDEIVKSTDPELGTRRKCQGYSGQGKVVYYTRSNPGIDRFEYTSSSTNGDVHMRITGN